MNNNMNDNVNEYIHNKKIYKLKQVKCQTRQTLFFFLPGASNCIAIADLVDVRPTGAKAVAIARVARVIKANLYSS